MASTSKDKIFLPGKNRPVTIFFSVVPLVTALVAIFCLYSYRLPYVLVGLLAILIASCLILAKEAISQLGDTTIELSAQDLTIRKLVGGATYPWTEIESIKLLDPGATFSDHSIDDQKSCAIGLILRKPDRKAAPPDDQPDVIVVSRSGEDAASVSKAFDRVSAYKRGGTAAPTGQRKGGLTPAKGFRRPAAA